MGPDGAAAAAFAATTAPRIPPGRSLIAHIHVAGSPSTALANVVSGNGGGGMGFPLPALLLASVAGAFAFAVWRLVRR